MELNHSPQHQKLNKHLMLVVVMVDMRLVQLVLRVVVMEPLVAVAVAQDLMVVVDMLRVVVMVGWVLFLLLIQHNPVIILNK